MKRINTTETVGSRIAAIRGDKTLEEFAKSIGVSRQAVAKWERGESPPKVVQLEKISEVYGFDLAFIAFGLSNPDTRDMVTRAIGEKVQLLTEPQKELILANVNALLDNGNGANKNEQKRN